MPDLVFDEKANGDSNERVFCIAYSPLKVVGGCRACGQKEGGWAAMVSYPNSEPFLIACAECVRELMGILFHRFLEIRKGEKPMVIRADPFPREEA